MSRIFLEANAINSAWRASCAGQDVRQILDAQGKIPVVGMHVIYEIGRGFLHSDHAEGAKERFQIIQDLNPEFSQTVRSIICQELNCSRTQTPIIPFLNNKQESQAREEVRRLAKGDFTETARNFIEGRQRTFSSGYPTLYQLILDQVLKIRANSPEVIRNLRTFEAAVEFFKFQVPQVVCEVLKDVSDPPNYAECLAIATSLGNYPAISAVVRANLLMNFMCIQNRTQPGPDKGDDFRHVIEASYCDVIVTNDKQLTNYVKKIIPNLDVLTWQKAVPVHLQM